MFNFSKLTERLMTFSDYKYYVKLKNDVYRNYHEESSWEQFARLHGVKYSKTTTPEVIIIHSNSIKLLQYIKENEDFVFEDNLPIYYRLIFTRGEDAGSTADDILKLLSSFKLIKLDDNRIATEKYDKSNEDRDLRLKMTFKSLGWSCHKEEGLSKND